MRPVTLSMWNTPVLAIRSATAPRLPPAHRAIVAAPKPDRSHRGNCRRRRQHDCCISMQSVIPGSTDRRRHALNASAQGRVDRAGIITFRITVTPGSCFAILFASDSASKPGDMEDGVLLGDPLDLAQRAFRSTGRCGRAPSATSSRYTVSRPPSPQHGPSPARTLRTKSLSLRASTPGTAGLRSRPRPPGSASRRRANPGLTEDPPDGSGAHAVTSRASSPRTRRWSHAGISRTSRTTSPKLADLRLDRRSTRPVRTWPVRVSQAAVLGLQRSWPDDPVRPSSAGTSRDSAAITARSDHDSLGSPRHAERTTPATQHPQQARDTRSVQPPQTIMPGHPGKQTRSQDPV